MKRTPEAELMVKKAIEERILPEFRRNAGKPGEYQSLRDKVEKEMADGYTFYDVCGDIYRCVEWTKAEVQALKGYERRQIIAMIGAAVRELNEAP